MNKSAQNQHVLKFNINSETGGLYCSLVYNDIVCTLQSDFLFKEWVDKCLRYYNKMYVTSMISTGT